MTEGETRRLDKWLWFARFFKSRSLATKFCATGKLRINGTVIKKAHTAVRAGDVLTFPKGDDIRVVRIEDLGTRRGPAPEARTLYTDLAPPEARKPSSSTSANTRAPARPKGAGRPTKAERRAFDKLRGRE